MLIVVGLAFEARIAAQSGLPVVCAGNHGDFEAALGGAIDSTCQGLVSFGVAGGLRPGLKPGTCIIGTAVAAGGRRFATNARWAERLLQRLPGAVAGVVAGVPQPVATAEAKAALHRDTGADAVDMESHVVAGAAERHGLPMAVIRVVCDPAARALPDIAFRSVRADGTTNVMTLLGSIARQPHHLPAMVRLALDARSARAGLQQCGRLLGPRLGLSSLAATGWREPVRLGAG